MGEQKCNGMHHRPLIELQHVLNMLLMAQPMVSIALSYAGLAVDQHLNRHAQLVYAFVHGTGCPASMPQLFCDPDSWLSPGLL